MTALAAAFVLGAVFHALAQKVRHRHYWRVTGIDYYTEGGVKRTRLLKVCGTCGKQRTRSKKGRWTKSQLEGWPELDEET